MAKKMQKEFDIFADIWGLLDKYYHPSGKKEYWDGLDSDVKKICAKHKGKYCIDLALATVEELERKFAESNGEQEDTDGTGSKINP